eukprot:g1453.t1
MSIYENDGGGSIWSSGSIFFASQSAINDILEKDSCTLNELLNEEDLLQELKGLNVKLLNYLESPKNLSKLIRYFTKPGSVESEDATERRRYPFIACEVFMCDVKQITSKAMEWKNNDLLKEIMSCLDVETDELSPQIAGYFSKVFQLLARRHPNEMLSFWQSAGPKTLDSFLKHLNSYSVMEALRCILNLKIEMAVMGCSQDEDLSGLASDSIDSPDTERTSNVSGGAVSNEDGSNSSGSGSENAWLQSPTVIAKLLGCLKHSSDPDVHENVSEVLAYFCGSDMMPRNDTMVRFLESATSCETIVSVLCGGLGSQDCGVGGKTGEASKETEKDDGGNNDGEPSDAKASSSTTIDSSSRVAALQITLHLLESFLMSQQQRIEPGTSFMGDEDELEAGMNTIVLTSELPSIARALFDSSAKLRALLGKQHFDVRRGTDGVERPAAGRARRLLIDVVSHLVIMGSSSFSAPSRTAVCSELAKTGLVPLCFDLFFKFDRCNIIHNHVINILMHIVSRAHMEPVAATLFRRSAKKKKEGECAGDGGGDDEYGLLGRILAEYAVNEKVLKGGGGDSRKQSVARGNYGHLHKFANIIVEASQLPTSESDGAEEDASGVVMTAPRVLKAAVNSNEEWQTFVKNELQRINKEMGASTPDTPGLDGIESPGGEGFGDAKSWMTESSDAIDDMDPHMAAMMHRVHLGMDENSSEDDSSGSDDDDVIVHTTGSGSGNDDAGADGFGGHGNDDDDTSWANFDDFPDDSEDAGAANAATSSAADVVGDGDDGSDKMKKLREAFNAFDEDSSS